MTNECKKCGKLRRMNRQSLCPPCAMERLEKKGATGSARMV